MNRNTYRVLAALLPLVLALGVTGCSLKPDYAEPTPTPEPTSTPEVTATPEVTSTPEAAAAPTPEMTAAPEPEQTADAPEQTGTAQPTQAPLDAAPGQTPPESVQSAPQPTAAPVVQPPANGGAPSAPTAAPCQHEWVTETVVDQPEVGHFGPIDPNLPYPSYEVQICDCGAEFLDTNGVLAHQAQYPADSPEWGKHSGFHNGIRNNQQWIVDQPEITHTVTRCAKCGATQ